MLKNLHVKNLALIKEADIEFHPGLNILTGETGAGKSLLMGSVNLALGAKFAKGMIRNGADYALVELEFSIEKEETAQLVRALGYEADDVIVISRKMGGSKGIFRINGESAPASDVKVIASYLLDIHGQHEHQSLLDKKRQLQILDRFCADDLTPCAEKVRELYLEHKDVCSKLSEYEMPEDERLREISLLEYELNEIERTMPYEGEEEELDAKFLKMKNAKDINIYAGEAYELLSREEGARDAVGKALSDIERISAYDSQLSGVGQSLRDIESILEDTSHELSSYLDDMDFSENDMQRISDRLDTINHLKARYGKTVGQINEYKEKCAARLEFLADYQAGKEMFGKQEKKLLKELNEACEKLSNVRKAHSAELSSRIVKELEELNFRKPRFEISFEKKEHPAENGYDDICFMISANMGEPIQPLSKVASGGEISRIMLAIKTILSDDDSVDVLVFDEIDSGISGRTAVKVAEKMSLISKRHQVICITHLAQIAAKADEHYLIKKDIVDDTTVTDIVLLDYDNSVKELARILGGEEITEAALENAREMKAKQDEG